MTKRIAFFLFVTLLAFNFLQGAPVIFENLPIERIEITVANSQEGGVAATQVRSKIKTREGDVFSQSEFDQDLKNLSFEFDRVDPLLSVNDGKLSITLKVWPKPTIRTIGLTGNCKITTKRLLKELATSPCTVFDRKAFNESFHKLKTYYVKKGFFEAELDYTLTFEECSNEVDILITINEGRSGRIKCINFSGFTPCEEDDILSKMVTKEYNLLFSWLNDEGTYREDAMQHDQFQILNYLQNLGYADAEVDIEVTEAGCDNRIVILITAEKGEIYCVNKITFNGNCLFTDEEIFSRFKIFPGAPYSPEKIRDTVSNIQDLYGKFGYIDAYVNFEPNLECERTYSVDFVIEEGEQFRIGLIKIFGNATTQSNVILHETLLIPGNVFNVERLKKTEQKLMEIGYFKKVNVYAVKTEESLLEGNYRDVHIEVDETSTGKFGLFFGFSTTEDLFGGINVSENNFNIAGLPYVWNNGLRSLRGGGEYLNLAAQIGSKSRSYSLSWTKPYFMDTKWSLGFDIEKSYNTYLSKDIDIEALSFTLRSGRQLNAFLRFQWHWRLTDSQVYIDESSIAKPEGYTSKQWKALPKKVRRELNRASIRAQDPHLAEIEGNDGTVSATGVALTYDSTDSIANPTSGFRSSVEVEIAGLGGQYFFTSYSYLNTYYYPFTDSLILKYRGDLRFINPFGETTYNSMPLDERLFLGNNTFVRGYRPFKIGPRFDNTKIPSGGLSQQFLSVELNKKFTKRFDSFIFMDLGHLSKNQWNFDWNQFRGSLGFGFRITLMDALPPISLGMGYPINPKGSSEVKRFFIQFGCKF